jgi:heat shock protein HslJ
MFSKPLALITLALGLSLSQAYAANTPSGEWELQSVTGVNPALFKQLNQPIKLSFNKATLSGSDGCNLIQAPYQANNHQLKIMTEKMMSTMMACTGTAQQFSKPYINALATTTAYQQTAQNLKLLNSKGQVVATYKAPITGYLMKTNWRLQSYLIPNKARVSSLNTPKMTVSFGADGILSGSAGCNHYHTNYRINPKTNRIELGAIASTKKYCVQPTDLMKEEQQFLVNLQQVKSFKRSGSQLALWDNLGNRLLNFEQIQ